MEQANAKGDYRCLTPQEIGSMVAMFRKMMDWKQLTLAYEAGVSDRTVQRIECGEKVDDKTLRRIAKAFRLRGEGFVGPRYVATHEEALEAVKAQLDEAQKELMVIEAFSLGAIKDCEAILKVHHGNIVDDSVLPAEMADQVAALMDQLKDSADIWRDLTNVEKLGTCRSVLAEVQKIEEQGFKIRYGVYETEDNFRISVLVFGACYDVSFVSRTQLVVPRRF